MPIRLCRECEMECEMEEMRRGLCPTCYYLDKAKGDDEPLAVDEMMRIRRKGRRG